MFRPQPLAGVVCLREGHYPPGWQSPRHQHRFGQLLLVRQGQVRVELADTAVELALGALLAIPAGHEHAWESCGRVDLRFFDLSLEMTYDDGRFWQGLLGLLARRSLLLLADAAPLLSAAERIEQAAGAQGPGQVYLEQGAILGFLGRVQQLFAANATATEDPVRQVESELAVRHAEALSLEQMAGWVGVSAKHLCRLFQRAGRPSPMAQVTALRLATACELLAETRLPVARIARRCGYADSQYFSRVFRRHQGCTPSAYRRQLSGE